MHTAPVNEVSFDSDGEYVGSCSDDGTVVISSLYTDDKEKFEYHRPVKAVALDPEYARKGSKQFALGGLAGQLLFLSKGWLGYKEQVQIQRHFKVSHYIAILFMIIEVIFKNLCYDFLINKLL